MSAENKIQDNHKKRIQHAQIVSLYLMIYDAVAVSAAYFVALLLRFDLRFSMIQEPYFDMWLKFAPYYAFFCICVFYALRLYNSIWRFASYTELLRVTLATMVTTITHVIFITVFLYRMPISYYVVGAFLQFILILGVRFSYRFVLLLRSRNKGNDLDHVMLIGAGSAGQMILRDVRRSGEVKEKIVCIIDDNPNKWGRELEGVPIVGGRAQIIHAVEKYNVDIIYIALPSISSKSKKDILEICKETNCELKNLPGIYQLVRGDVTVSNLKKVEVEDLLGREPVQMGGQEIRDFLTGKTVLITSGGGSIGSELCRQVAAVKELKQLIIFDIYENNAHAIKLELMDQYPDLNLVVLIGLVRNSMRLRQIFEQYRPDIVFHAAAHKHVPLMEDSPNEAIKNNVQFVLISTDKAVNPVNIMGASKRLCEMIIQTFAKKIAAGKASEIPDMQIFELSKSKKGKLMVPEHPKTKFVAVRFGNVLGSNGSVIPRFREQIEKGGVGLILRAT